MGNEETLNKTAKNLSKTGDGFIKGSKVFHMLQGKNYKIKLPSSGKVNVLLNKGRNNWIFRLDKPHANVDFNHINVNAKYSGIPDPHLKLPPGAMTVGRGTAKVCQVMNQANKILIPLAIAIDTARVGFAGCKDYQNGTSRNIVETTGSVAGGWAGGYGGAVGGAAIGTAICPGIGTILGGIFGAVSGGITGSLATGAVIDAIGDAVEYDIEEIKCENCGNQFKARKYKGDKQCDRCLEKLKKV